VDAHLLQLLINQPLSIEPSPAQLTALRVLADQWSEQGLAGGLWLSERLQGPVSEARQKELGFEDWWGGVDVRAQALLLDPQLEASASQLAQSDLALSVQLLSFVGTAKEGWPLHAPIAAHLEAMLRLIERRELEVVSYRDWKYQLANGWSLDVFVRAWDFWRVDRVITPRGDVLHLVDFDDGPLAELNEYEPPTDVEAEVYGLGTSPFRRQWR